MSQNWRVGFDPASGTSIGWTLARSRLRRLAEESSGHLDEGEKLVTPVAIYTRREQCLKPVDLPGRARAKEGVPSR